jgi:hypothetical protein
MTRVVAQALDTPGHPENAGWEAATRDGGDHVHVVPLTDALQHTEDDDADCACGPRVEPCERDDGSMGWLIVHHSLDGRERYEAAQP